MLKWILLIGLLCLIYEIISNLGNVIFLNKTIKMIQDRKNILGRIPHVKRLCSNAGLTINLLSFFHPESSISDILSYSMQATGEYKRMIGRCFNPIHWVEVVVFLPGRIISYFGGNPRNFLSYIFNAVYWVINIYITLFPTEARMVAEKLFDLIRW